MITLEDARVVRPNIEVDQWVMRVSQATDILATPCNASLTVAVEAFFIASPRLLWSLAKPDPMDLVTRRFGIGHRNKRKRRFSIDDITLPESAPKKGQRGWATFAAGNIAERIGWYMLVADVTTDGLVLWTSTVWQMSGCDTPGGAYRNLRVVGGVFGPNNSDWSAIGVWNNEGGQGTGWTPLGIEIIAGQIATLGFTARVTEYAPDPNSPPPLEFRMIEITSGDTIVPVTAEPDGAGGIGAASIFRQWRTDLPNQIWRVQYRGGFGQFQLAGSTFWANAQKLPHILSDP